MASTSEASFGNKLAKGKQLLGFIKSLSNYNPPVQTLSINDFERLLSNVDSINSTLAGYKNLLQQARLNRNELYYGENGCKKRGAMIRDFVGILPGGKTSSAYLSIQREMQKINNYKKPTKKDEMPDETNVATKRTTSTAETSFGSVLQSLKNILEVIKNVPNYTPENSLITIASFSDYIAKLEQSNQEVNATIYPYNDSVKKRVELYDGIGGLRETFQNIKTFIGANYGKSSNEFIEVSKIKF